MFDQAGLKVLLDQLEPRLAASLLKTSRDTFDYDQLAAFAASVDSAQFATEQFGMAVRYESDEALLRAAVPMARPEGLFLEFGVASGRTLRIIAETHPGPVFGFDSFGGLPETWRPGFEVGAFAQAPPATRENAALVIGLFGDSLPRFLADHAGPVGFLHVDCDLYSSTATIFGFLRERIVPGTVIVFDEFLNYPGWRLHEYKAFMEFIGSSGKKFRYIGCVPSHQQVAVVIE
ncbi:MAG TPA: class I SAM-dependent methyltransferase [Acidiphilium sp.]